MLKQLAGAVLVILLISLGLTAQFLVDEADRKCALRAALYNEGALKAYEEKVGPLARQGVHPYIIVYLDPGSPPGVKIYVVEWLDPRSLYLTSLLKVKVRVIGGVATVVSVDC